MQGMIERWITQRLEQTMGHTPAVTLLGTRQVGKTTLAQSIAESRTALYLDLESPEDLLKLSDPSAFLSLHGDKLVIIDEIQRVPDLFMVLRGLIDKNRRAGRKGEQYLLLGSASMDLLRQSSESLAGRISYIELAGLNLLEVPATTSKDRQKLWLRGGFPESYLAESDALAMTWLENLIRTYLERDVPQMGFRVPAMRLRRLWTMLAHLQGESVNFSKLGANLEVDGKTVSSYIDILVDLLLVRRLEPWHVNVKKRLVKSPHFYIRDSGILHRLLGIADYNSLLSNPVLGKSWEGFVIENILSVLPNQVEVYFYRTAAGAEIDLLLKLSGKELWAIEIKTSVAPKIKQGFHLACKDVKATRKYVIYGGGDEFPIAKDTTVLSLKGMLVKLQALS
ncbi:MAG TPA: ATP-binding protein [Gammaproteobacteria bacterium]|nr:ATP-binding protein [Gammaproteobacteria bacterium]